MRELTLSPQEIAEITGYQRYTHQQRQLVSRHTVHH